MRGHLADNGYMVAIGVPLENLRLQQISEYSPESLKSIWRKRRFMKKLKHLADWGLFITLSLGSLAFWGWVVISLLDKFGIAL